MNEYLKYFGQLNQETQEHSRRVADLCYYLGEKLNLNKELLHKIGYVHDLGKLYIPSRIIRKSEKLNTLEREIIDMHSYYGYRMLKDMGEGPEVYIPVLFHHGFMKPRIGEERNVLTEEMMCSIYIIHSADVFDAMMSKRVYHEPYSIEEVLETLEKDALCTSEILEYLSETDLYRNQIAV